jgi:hypothetical protein
LGVIAASCNNSFIEKNSLQQRLPKVPGQSFNLIPGIFDWKSPLNPLNLIKIQKLLLMMKHSRKHA